MPADHLRDRARQIIANAAARPLPASPAERTVDEVRSATVAKFPQYMRDTYGVDLSDPAQARAVLATLEFMSGAAMNAIRERIRDPLGSVVQGISAAAEATAPTIMRQEQP